MERTLPALTGLLHQPVSGRIVAGGLVNQQQVDIVGAQPLQRLVHRVRLLIEGGPQLGLQEDLLPLAGRMPSWPGPTAFSFT